MHCRWMYGCTVAQGVIYHLKVNKLKDCVVFLTRGVVDRAGQTKCCQEPLNSLFAKYPLLSALAE